MDSHTICCSTRITLFWLLLNYTLWILFMDSVRRANSDPQISSSACSYPHFSDRRSCNIHDSSLLNGWICDPDNTISMSEVYVIDDTLRRVYAQNERNCQCPLNKSKPCWYKFGFAFLRELTAPSQHGSTIEVQTDHHCTNYTFAQQTAVGAPPPPGGGYSTSALPKAYRVFPNAEMSFLHAQNYVRTLRERWSIGDCGEDILILVVHVPPPALISKQPFKSASSRYSLPMIFVSYGSHVAGRFGVVDTYTLPYALEPMRRIVDEENSNLRNTYPLNKVLNNLVLRTVEALKKVENTLQQPHRRDNIPLWAWIVFGVCAVSFLLMAIGLCLIRTTTRRGVQRGKSGNMDPQRRWKAGFVGEDNAPTTYVNLVNLLMPHPRPQVNFQQQV